MIVAILRVGDIEGSERVMVNKIGSMRADGDGLYGYSYDQGRGQ